MTEDKLSMQLFDATAEMWLATVNNFTSQDQAYTSYWIDLRVTNKIHDGWMFGKMAYTPSMFTFYSNVHRGRIQKSRENSCSSSAHCLPQSTVHNLVISLF